MSDLRVFIGSASENTPRARDLQDLLIQEGVDAKGWWDAGIFPAGASIFEALFEAAKQTNASLFMAGKDDLVMSRGASQWAPRDNVLFEYGLFSGLHGRHRTALVELTRKGETALHLPSDLGGIVTLRLAEADNSSEFRTINRKVIRDWIDTLCKAPPSRAQPPLPLLWETMLRVLGTHKDATQHIDLLASELLEAVVNAFDEDFGITETLTEGISDLLQRASSIHAVDVLGPQGWISPTAYRYLARQIKAYMTSNTTQDGWQLTVSEPLADAINRASSLATKYLIHGRPVLEQSVTEFDNSAGLQWCPGEPRLEFARILLWTEDEILSPVAASMIAIHEAFHIPLFFKSTPREHESRDFDYLYFQMRTGDIKGFYGTRSNHYKTVTIARGQIPLLGRAHPKYLELLRSPGMLFAADARTILLKERETGLKSETVLAHDY